jgi:hypothetical protein
MCETRRLRKKAKRLKREVKYLKSVLKSKLLSKDAVQSTETGTTVSSKVILPMGTGKQ